MKIRKGFVTNSSSTNFGTMIVTSVSSIGIASIVNAFNVDIQAKKKSYVRLIVEAPIRRILRPGNDVPLCGEVVKVDIIDGEVSDPVSVARADITCVEGEKFIEGSSDNYQVTTDMNKLSKNGGGVIFEVSATYEGKPMSAVVEFNLVTFNVDPMDGVFVVGQETEQLIDIETNSSSIFSNNLHKDDLLSIEVVQEDEMNQKLKLIEKITEPEKIFGKHTHTIIKKFVVSSQMGYATFEEEYSAKFLRECILVPRQLKEPIVIRCYPEKEKDKRIDTAVIIPIKVLKYDKNIDNLQTDVTLTNSLQFEFFPRPNQGHLTNEETRKVINDADLRVELEPKDGAANDKKPYARYRVYANALAEAELENIELRMSITSDGDNIDEVYINVQLKPKLDIKGLIRQFIQYPEGTFIGSRISLGTIDTYMDALDYISEIKVVNSGNPKYDPNKNIMYLNTVPESLQEFKLVQTIHHEIAHVIEIQHDDSDGSTYWNERHTYFIQYLSDAAKHLALLERGSGNVENLIGEAINAYHNVFYNIEANATEPANISEISSWFGVRTPTQHEIFDKYLEYSIYCQNPSLSDDIKDRVEREVARSYFPGNIMGRWKEKGGLFDGTGWRISWGGGNLMNINIDNSQYSFKELTRKWAGGNKLLLEVKFFVTRLSDGDEDDLIAILDGGVFDPSSYSYPSMNTISLTWKAGRTLSECILGDHRGKTVQLTK